MAKDRRKLQHIHSSIKDRQPTPATIEVGEIAVNNNADNEFLSIKNTNDKVIRFSSDGQIIEWMERKEVMPYVGYVRGGEGPSSTSAATPTADSRGSYGIQENDLINNTSEIIIKLNQVAASATTKHDRVNGANDKYNKKVNPTTDGGVTDGAGFFIDMSRYAMQDANPSFSGITNTCYTNLNGTTRIKGVNGDCGSLLEVTVNTFSGDIETANTQITSANTTIGTDILHTSGTTNITRDGAVTENNGNGYTATTTGVTCMHSTTDMNLGGDSNTRVGYGCDGSSGYSNNTYISASSSAITYAPNVIISGTTTEVTGSTTLRLSGNTINERSLTSNTTTTSAYTSATTATTVIGTSNTSATTATLSGNTLSVTENETTISSCGKLEITTDDFNLKQCNDGGTAEMEFCGGFTLKSDDVKIQQCGSSGSIEITEKNTSINGENLTITESGGTSISTTGNTCIQSTVDLDIYGSANTKVGVSCNGDITKRAEMQGEDVVINATTNNVGITAKNELNASAEGTINITSNDSICETAGANASFYAVEKTNIGLNCDDTTSSTTTNVYGETINENASTANTTIGDATTVITNDNTTIGTEVLHITGTTTITRDGSVTEDNKNGYTATTTGTVCEHSSVDMNIGGDSNTRIGYNCAGTSGYSNNTYISASSSAITYAPNILESGTTVNITGGTSVTVSGGSTANTYAPTINISGGNITEISTGKTCITAGSDLNMGGDANTRIGANCEGTSGYSNNTYITASSSAITYAPNIEISGSTTNITGATNTNIYGGDVCISGNTEASLGAKDVKIGTDCGGTTIANNITVNANTAITVNAPTTTISGSSNTNIYGGDVCISANTEASLGAKDVKIGTNCGGTTIATGITINASTAVTINAPTTNITGNTNISGNTVIGGDTNISGDTTIAGDTYISGDTKIGGDLVINIPCDTITSTTVNDALCEILERGEVTWKTSGYSASDENLKWYELYQNGAQIKDQNGNPVRIDIPKDHILKDAEVVYGKASGSAFTACTEAVEDCHWYIKLTWNVFTPAGHTDDKIVYIPADEFVTDIEAKNPNGVVADSYNNVSVNVWYENGKNWVSATTTPTIHVTQNLYADGTVSGATVSGTTGKFTTLSAGTTTISGVTTINNNLNVTGNTNITGTTNISGQTKIDDNLNVTGNVNITGTTNISGATKIDDKLTVTDVLDAQKGLSKTLKYYHNGFSGETNFSGDTTFNSPHSALTVTYESTSSKSGSITYNTSADESISIPTNISHLTNDLSYLKWSLGTPSADATGYNGSAEKTITIPSKISHLTNDLGTLTINYASTCNSANTSYNGSGNVTIAIPKTLEHVSCGHVKDTQPTTTGGEIQIDRNVAVTGSVSATLGFFQTSDERRKDNIKNIEFNDYNKVKNVMPKSFTLKDDESQRKMYGVIAQEVENAGLNELVHTDEEGYKAVDYTSLFMLKIAYLESYCSMLNLRVAELENKLNNKD